MKLLLILLSLLFFSGCGDSTSASSEDASTKTVSSSSALSEKSSSSSKTSVDSIHLPDGIYSSSSLALDSAWEALKPDVQYDEFKDVRDGQVYKTIDIEVDGGVQTWMAQNLNYAYEDGTQSWCANGTMYDTTLVGDCKLYGRIYTFASLAQGICPEGFHLPSEEEFSLLCKTFADSVDADGWTFYGAAASLMADVEWNFPSEILNTTGFSVLPAGSRRTTSFTYGKRASFWTSTEQDNYRAYDFVFAVEWSQVDDEIVYSPAVWKSNEKRDAALSVRCIKD